MKTLLASIVLLFASVLPAQQVPGSWIPTTTIGSSCEDSDLSPWGWMEDPPNTTDGRPILGQQITLLAPCPGSGDGTWLVTIAWADVNSAYWPPQNLSAVGCDACEVYIPATYTDTMSIPSGTGLGLANWTVTLPNDPGLLGADLYFQAVIFSSAYACGIGTTSMVNAIIGNV